MSDKGKCEDFVEEMYKIALQTYEYIHTDVWRGQQYYTTVNVAIISISFGIMSTLLKVQPLSKESHLMSIPLFVMGAIVSLFAYYSLKRMRESFLQAVWFKTLVEDALKDRLMEVFSRSQIQIDDFRKRNKKWRPTPVFDMPDKDHEEALKCKDLWIKHNIIRRGGITFYFFLLQWVFFAINLIGIAVGIWLRFS
jgi:hypothetical protein